LLDDTINYFQQSKLARHIPILLGLSLLPLHITTFVVDTRFDQLLWGNHLLLASLWYLVTSPRYQTAVTLLIIATGIFALGFSWSLPVAKTAWLLVLAALITGQTLTAPRDPLFWLFPAAYLLTLLGYQTFFGGFYPAPGFDTPPPLAATLVLNAVGSIAFAITLIPLTASADRKQHRVTEQTSTVLAVTTFVASAALVSSGISSTTDGELKLTVAVIFLFALVGVLLWNNKPVISTKPGYSRAFSQWMTQTLEALPAVHNLEQFIHDSMANLAVMLHISGFEWQIAGISGSLGDIDNPDLHTVTPAGHIASTTGQPPSASLEQQMQLALDFLATLAKYREQERRLKTQTHLESIYETGARITHDVKNLLQSLSTLTTAVEHSKPEQAEAIQSLIRKQLPLIRQKLRTTLEKLEAPEDVSSTFQVARIWWEKLRMRFEPNQIEFHLQLEMDYLIPRDLFERVAENLLENAQRKRQFEPDIAIRIELIVTEQRITLRVTDTGSPAPPEITELLFQGPIDSTGGYGIALYQCATQALQQGFELALTANEPGRVSFCLSGEIS